jgi:hypothetical protein
MSKTAQFVVVANAEKTLFLNSSNGHYSGMTNKPEMMSPYQAKAWMAEAAAAAANSGKGTMPKYVFPVSF